MTQQTEVVVESNANDAFFDGRKRPSGKWMLFSVLVAILAVGGSALLFNMSEDTTSAGNAKVTAITPRKEDVIVGGEGTPQYNAEVINDGIAKADSASSAGKSFMPTPVSSMSPPELDEIKIEAPQNNEEIMLNQEKVAALKNAVTVNLSNITEGMKLYPQTLHTHTHKQKDEKAGDSNERGSNAETGSRINNNDTKTTTVARTTLRLPGGVRAGSILYATNDLKLNSDGKNPVIRATILTGPMKNYVALGEFSNGGETLALSFSRLISPAGEEYEVEAYGIDPSIPEANVASDVDHHYLSRWGGFMASTFLMGFADATRISGTTTANGGVPGATGASAGMGYGTMIPEFNLANKGIIAVGEVGRAAAQELTQNLKRPPTVTLDPGMPIGILIVGAGSSSNESGSN